MHVRQQIIDLQGILSNISNENNNLNKHENQRTEEDDCQLFHIVEKSAYLMAQRLNPAEEFLASYNKEQWRDHFWRLLATFQKHEILVSITKLRIMMAIDSQSSISQSPCKLGVPSKGSVSVDRSCHLHPFFGGVHSLQIQVKPNAAIERYFPRSEQPIVTHIARKVKLTY